LKYVSYEKDDLLARVRRNVEVALKASRMSLAEPTQDGDEGLSIYTYLERSGARLPFDRLCFPSLAALRSVVRRSRQGSLR
jgi:hypothetical protein